MYALVAVQVGVDYDPMIAKVIATGADRTAALASLRKVLGELQVRLQQSWLPKTCTQLCSLATAMAVLA